MWAKVIMTAVHSNHKPRRSIANVTFGLFDVDGDGFLNKEDLMAAVRKCCGTKVASSLVVAQMISLLDQDEKGTVSRSELREGLSKVLHGDTQSYTMQMQRQRSKSLVSDAGPLHKWEDAGENVDRYESEDTF